MDSSRNSTHRAIVIGGSLGGLFAGNILRSIGWEVDIYERSQHDLDSRGGGLVLQPDVVDLFAQVGGRLQGELGVASRDRVTFLPDGKEESRYFAPQTQTSWNLIYNEMKTAFGSAHYHQGRTLIDLCQDESQVTAVFADGFEDTAELLIGADGGRSTVRSLVDPGNDPQYAGYVAWRGLLEESKMPEPARSMLGNFSFANNHESHILGYLVPGEGNSTKAGERLYNWVWYRAISKDRELPDLTKGKDGEQRQYTVPPGELATHWKERLDREADSLLPPGFRAVVQVTPQPFAQAILDLTSQHMIWGRVLTLGDAAFIPRPHTAASTSKAAANALGLGRALSVDPSPVAQSMKEWELQQLRLGKALYQQGSRTGDHLLFGR